jgi:pyrroline-5-carboxylate reductase
MLMWQIMHASCNTHDALCYYANCPAWMQSCDATAAGTTIHAVHALEKAGVRAAFINAVLTAADRSEQLAKL